MTAADRDELVEVLAGHDGAPDDDPWGGQNPLGCCRNYVTEGGVPTHGGPGCVWPGPADPQGGAV